MSENKAIDKANLELALSENNKRLLEHTDTADTELRQNLNVMSQYHKYLNTELGYIHVTSSQDITVNNTAVGTVIPFTTVTNSNDIDFDASTYTFNLKAGKTYKIIASIRTLNTASYIYYQAYNVTKSKWVGAPGCTETPSSHSVNVAHKFADSIISCDEDTEIQIRVSGVNATKTAIFASISSVTIQEINRQIVIDPVEHINTEYGLEDAPVGHIISHMGTKAPSHYLICDGSEYNILDYPYLANHILENFGSYNYFGGDGELTFAVPDLRGEFLRGTGTATRDTGSGAEVGEHQEPTQHPDIYCSNYGKTLYIGIDGTTASLGRTEAINKDSKDRLSEYGLLQINGSPSSIAKINMHYTSRPTNTSVLYCIKYEPTYYTSVQNTNYLSASLYSEEERVIGSWINGKPLYEKTVTFDKTSTGTITTLTALGIKDWDELWVDDGYCINSAGTVRNFFPHDIDIYIQVHNSTYPNGDIRSGDSTKATFIWVLKYTKTTDAENSFTNDMIKDYIVQSNNSESYSDEDINTAITETINLLNEV